MRSATQKVSVGTISNSRMMARESGGNRIVTCAWPMISQITAQSSSEAHIGIL